MKAYRVDGAYACVTEIVALFFDKWEAREFVEKQIHPEIYYIEEIEITEEFYMQCWGSVNVK